MFKQTLAVLFTAAALMFAVASPAQAEKPSHAPHSTAKHGADDGHGHDKGGGHDKAGGHDEGGHGDAHGEDHGDGHGEHYLYTEDSDHDGMPNWLDRTDGTEPNTHNPLLGMGYHAFNLVVLFGLLFWFGRRPIADAVANRALGIRKAITDSARLRDEAKQRNDELVNRLDKIEGEIEQMRVKAADEAVHEEAALVARAEAESERIQQAAERNIRDEVQRARTALKKDAVSLAVDLAGDSLKSKVTPDHQNQFAREFLESIKTGGVDRV